MRQKALSRWEQAKRALATARLVLTSGDFDAAASRAYYAAFYAVSALFLMEGKFFAKHSGVEAAVHGELVKPGRWPVSTGKDYRDLRNLRSTGDFGFVPVSQQEASRAVSMAEGILALVHQACPDFT